MIDYTLSIKGPGSCVNNVLVVVEQALRQAGFTVQVENPYPPTVSDKRMWEHVRSLQAPGGVKIDVEHYPWGG